MNYYNDNDKFAAKWINALIEAELIPNGYVDDRSIIEVKPHEIKKYKQCHFFAGIAGWPRALELAGWRPDRPIWSASLPCQPLSCAGQQRGEKDERHLWPIFFNLVEECRPSVILGEQVASKDGREWLAGIQTDLETLGYYCAAADLPAASVASPHKRNRLFWVATLVHSIEQGLEGHSRNGNGRQKSGRVETNKVGSISKTSPAGRLADSNSGRSQNGRTKSAESNFYQGYENIRPKTPELCQFWSNSIAIPCADGKWRRVPGKWVEDTSGAGAGDHDRQVGRQERQLEIESSIFSLLSDGISAIMGVVWSKGCTKTMMEVESYAKKTKTRPGEILQALWQKALQETVQRNTGGHDTFSETEILFVALCELQGHQKQEVKPTTPNITEVEEVTMRVLWQKAPQISISTCTSYKWGLDGSQTGKYQNTMRGVSFETAHETGGEMQGLRRKSAATPDVSEAFSALEKTWRSIADKDMRWSKKMEDCKGWCYGLTQFPLAPRLPSRVGLLRGAGNSIVPQVAAEFVSAVMDIIAAGVPQAGGSSVQALETLSQNRKGTACLTIKKGSDNGSDIDKFNDEGLHR